MEDILYKFTLGSLFDAVKGLLGKLHVKFDSESNSSIRFKNLYASMVPSPMPKALGEVVSKISDTYLIGSVDEETLKGRPSSFDLGQPLDGKYHTMVIFAVDIKKGETLTRSELATLTRGFNRMAPQLPVVVFIRNGKSLTLATCERSDYKQDGRQGEKLGKVSILRDINCEKPHRGHLDILASLGDKAYTTFDELYRHWLEVFSSELLTKKFYTELSEWYAFVISSGKVRFPNDITTTEDDAKYNHEAVIRLITRLIFVWFLKQKHLIPEEFFDEKEIREHFIENFDPRNTLFYDPEESKYYRLILQNLFFAMLNRPINDEEDGKKENRRFVTAHRYKGKSTDYNINNLLRYKSEFKAGGADRLLELANSQVPFLNGGLFESLDDKDVGMYYDGFSERKASLEQLSFPDYFFFGEEVGKDVDLSAWYGAKGKRTNVRGLIDILRSYNFTVEENTPLDQEVSLDPELLGKVFENLLASYNPETNTTARKQTGSFYTPRDIVKYMVDESLVAHLKRTCLEINESVFRDLFNYSVESLDLSEADRQKIMTALYECKVLDPACGSGAFPMGILQQMVHALRKLDPTNEMWRKFILKKSLEKDKEAYETPDQEERTRLRADIEQSFNNQVNDPDYARKLYLIENRIYGVDIQPIATQISKLRFFISLVADQKPTSDPITNFGIRPLPNLEAKFVAANSLIRLEKTFDLFSSTEDILRFKSQLAKANHKLFQAKRNKDKRSIRISIEDIRKQYAQELKSMGIVTGESAFLLADWRMFDQNSAARFFDAEWMFDITNGFDIVIGNPPYVEVTNSDSYIKYKTYSCYELYAHFFERGIELLKPKGILSFITGSLYIKGMKFSALREYLTRTSTLIAFRNEGDNVFEEVGMPTSTILVYKGKDKCVWPFDGNDLVARISSGFKQLGDLCEVQRGLEIGRKSLSYDGEIPILTGTNVKKYIPKSMSFITTEVYEENAKDEKFYEGERFVIRETGAELTVVYLNESVYVNRSLYTFLRYEGSPSVKFLVGCLNSKLLQYFYIEKFKAPTELFPKIRIGQAKQLPIAKPSAQQDARVSSLVTQIIKAAQNNISYDSLQTKIDIIIYQLYGLSYEEIRNVDPDVTISKEEYERHV